MRVYGFVRQPSGNNRGPDALLLRALNDRLTKTDLSMFFAEVSGNRVESFMLIHLLRFLVDKWIDSGRSGDEESPWERQPWHEPLQDYMERNPPKLYITKDGLSLFVGSPPIEHNGRKTFSWLAEYVKQNLTLVPKKRYPDAQFRKALHAAADPASALYLQLLDSPISDRLLRCDGCRSYFVRSRAPKKGVPIYRGSWCARCKGKGGARRTNKSRENRTKKMVEFAADAWMQWRPDRHHGECAQWVAQQMNDRMPEEWERLKKTNWVTRHKSEIDAEVERRKHGTQKTR